jgi:DNA-binding transcriptional regulator YiaG
MLSETVLNLIKSLGGGEEMISNVEIGVQKMKVGDEITALRESMDMSESDFATLLGISTADLKKIEEGYFEEDPQDVLIKIQEAVSI